MNEPTKEELEKIMRSLNDEHAKHWRALKTYLFEEVMQGKREFRIAFQDHEKFIIHPLNKDGKTIDFSLSKGLL